jgi:chromosome segregation protein
MKIKCVEIAGFKSFVAKATLHFASGIVGVVGPNGCGKSNIADAIRWALGEQTMRRLRGQGLDDLIFNGSEGCPPLGMAEVSVLFDVEPGDVEGDYGAYSEIMVTRRLFRSGETECLINNLPCRLRDILELLQGTGLGARAYSMVEQGQIEQLVHARPEERRTLIEELAGISRFKGRRLAAERKMERTRQNLLRVKDILGEVDRQVSSLNRQAKKAERYRRIRGEVRRLELVLASRKSRRLEDECCEKQEKQNALEKRAEELRESMRSLDRDLATGRERVISQETNLENARQHRSYWEGETRRLEQEGALVQMKIKELEESFVRFEKHSQERRKKQQEIGAEIAALEGTRMEVEKALLVEVRGLEEKEKEAEGFLTSILKLESEIEKCKTDLIGVLMEEAQFRNRVSHLEKRSEELRAERIKMDGLAEEGRARIENLRTELDQRSRRIERANADLLTVQAEREDAAKAIEQIRSEQQEVVKEMDVLKEEISDVRSRCSSLVELQKNYEGFQEGVRSIMMRQNGNGQEPHLVAEVMEALPSFERALAAALGEKLQYVIVQSHEEGLEAIRFLREESAGRGTFIPLQLVNSDGETSHRPTDPLLERVKVEEGFEGIAGFLLGNVDLVPDTATGLDRWKKGARQGVHVTAEGDVIHPSGALSGGRGDSIEEKILSRKREIKELEVRAGDLQTLHHDLSLSKEKHGVRLMDQEGLLRSLDQQLQGLRLETLAAEKDAEKIREEMEQRIDRLEVIGYEQTLRVEEFLAGEKDLAEAREALSVLTTKHEELEFLRREIQREHTGRSQAVGELQGSVVLLKVQIAKLRERIEHTQRTLERLHTIARELRSDEEAQESELLRNQEEKKRHQEREAEIRDSLRKIEGELETSRRSLEALTGERDNLSKQLMVWEEERSSKRSDLETIERESGAVQIELTQKVLEREHLKQEIWDRYGVPLEMPQDYENKPVLSEVEGIESTEEDHKKLEDLKDDLRRIGEVSLDSISELEDLKNRQGFLSAQKEDLEKSLVGLSHTVSHLNREFRKRFLETFEDLNRRFSEVFPKLFAGGHAHLALTDTDNLLESGVDVVVQPPGKKLQSVGLLSGGEKSLSALALIFSMFLIKPAPFFLLDEVDAALDDANIDRFNEVVREMSTRSQMILVTHNKKTIELAHVLYGVTMQEAGKSKIVSVSIQ